MELSCSQDFQLLCLGLRSFVDFGCGWLSCLMCQRLPQSCRRCSILCGIGVFRYGLSQANSLLFKLRKRHLKPFWWPACSHCLYWSTVRVIGGLREAFDRSLGLRVRLL